MGNSTLLLRAVRVITKAGDVFIRVYLGKSDDGFHLFGGQDSEGNRFVDRFSASSSDLISVQPVRVI
jgi:hypothetical protein